MRRSIMPTQIVNNTSIKNDLLILMDEKLKSHASYKSGDFDSDSWVFDDSRYVTTIDLTLSDIEELNSTEQCSITIDDVNFFELTQKEFTKVLLLESIKTLSSTSVINSQYQSLLSIWIVRHQLEHKVKKGDLKMLLNFIMTTKICKPRLQSRLKIASYKTLFSGQPLEKIMSAVSRYRYNDLIDNISTPKINKLLNQHLIDNFDLTLADYQQGNSFNFLGLDAGQLYADYLSSHFSEHYLYVLTCVQTIQETTNLLENKGLNVTFYNRSILLTLQGIRPTKKDYKGNHGSVDNFISTVPDTVRKVFIKKYNENSYIASSLQPNNIQNIIERFGLTQRFDSIELIRALLINRYYKQDLIESKKVLARYQSSIKDSYEIGDAKLNFQHTTLDKIYEMVDSFNPEELLRENYYTTTKMLAEKWRCNVDPILNKALFNKSITMFIAAGTELLISYTGWRKSEFGFSISNFHIESNTDILDSTYVPYRYFIRWKVWKTSGALDLNREITSTIYWLSRQISRLNLADDDNHPCLLSKTADASDKNSSNSIIKRVIGINWPNFIDRYTPFNDIRKISSLVEERDNKQLHELQSKYHTFDLQKIKRILSEIEGDRQKLTLLGQFDPVIIRECSKNMYQYQEHNGVISDKVYQAFFDEHLSSETKTWLFTQQTPISSLNPNEKKMITANIYNELRGDAVYPTPHAWRHIWAEAVLTRYEGNIAAVLRHNFKYMDNSFFMAYLRNKNNAPLYERAHRTAINSIVSDRLERLESTKREYVSGFNRFIQKVIGQIKIISNEGDLNESELRAVKEKLADRIIFFNAKPYANCVPRKGSVSRAKCAENGELKSHNAKPSFCLGCINADVHEGHLQGIVTYLDSTVRACLDDSTPIFLLGNYVDLINLALKRFREITTSENKGFILKVNNIYNQAVNHATARIKEEKNE